ncbi:hypothetical protein GQ53DRAFT_762625 [Thozetella sp. PMI_491]|nr:hypothetical protein GQ53DRAFT_762625 [Thozetella sp. PMI_491]
MTPSGVFWIWSLHIVISLFDGKERDQDVFLNRFSLTTDSTDIIAVRAEVNDDGWKYRCSPSSKCKRVVQLVDRLTAVVVEMNGWVSGKRSKSANGKTNRKEIEVKEKRR